MQDSMKFDPESGNTDAFSERELFDIMSRAERLAEMEVCNGGQAALRGRLARMWLRFADAANEAHAFTVRYERETERNTRPPTEDLGDGPVTSDDYGRV